ncbi:putative casein kinase-1 hhp1 [Desarmillaria tabescens]|uniref:non-specific serine/threonine protein kinase n=1 Tax=Armillaria tabescens TaxID=1929756 RepID=A0AA39MXF1_ARMTA|nr:putative casein kinase-1 hhp1 [Desarmillaria tabescens]KAK0450511.1 putative casein kinase-1 hhp1 [Desarmillaria tabescens]
MSSARLTYQRAPYGKALLGQGSYSNVFKSTELESGKTVALKMSRVSRRVKRPILQHETRILQLLKGQAAIPLVYAYGQLEHFEYMAMEILGPSVVEQQKTNGPGTGMMLTTVIRIVDQMLAGLEHIHSLGIVHRDIKPENLLCAFDDSTIKIIDFGISKPFSHGQPSKYDPLKDRRAIVGSLYWASLNSHNGLDLYPRDDLESLAYIALFLLRGHLPWKPRPREESQLRSQEIVRLMKSSCSGKGLSEGLPADFGDLLDYTRSLDFDQLPDYERFRRIFGSIVDGRSNGPLDWTPSVPQTNTCVLDEPQLEIPGEDEDEDDDDDSDDLGENTYFGMDIDIWDSRQGERDKDLTLLAEQEVDLDSRTPQIVEPVIGIM